MIILEKKVCTKTNQIKNFKSTASNKSFVEIMDKLEIIQLDLELVEKIEEMANSLAISKIETRLPENFKKYWGKFGVKETMEDSSSMLK